MVERSATIPSPAQLDITTMAAIGDSYSAGIGAGDMLLTTEKGKITHEATSSDYLIFPQRNKLQAL